MPRPAHRLADELEDLGMVVDRTHLHENTVMAADDETVFWANVPTRAPNGGLYLTRPLTPSESPDDIETISPLSVASPADAEPYTELDADVYGLFRKLDALYDDVARLTEAR